MTFTQAFKFFTLYFVENPKQQFHKEHFRLSQAGRDMFSGLSRTELCKFGCWAAQEHSWSPFQQLWVLGVPVILYM